MRIGLQLRVVLGAIVFLGCAQADLVFVDTTINSGSGLSAGGQDVNFQLIDNRSGTPVNLGNPYVVASTISYDGGALETAFPFAGHRWNLDGVGWFANDETSSWLAPQSEYAPTTPRSYGGADPEGWYSYVYTFSLPNEEAASNARISGLWAADNIGQIVINGTAAGSCTDNPCFMNWNFFDVASGFTAGINRLEFRVYNTAGQYGNPVGLRVQMTQSYFYDNTNPAGVPEPVTATLAGAALLGFYVLRRHLSR